MVVSRPICREDVVDQAAQRDGEHGATRPSGMIITTAMGIDQLS